MKEHIDTDRLVGRQGLSSPTSRIASPNRFTKADLKDTGVTVTVLKPGVTDTNFFETASMEPGTPVGEGPKDDPTQVAQTGFDAMEKGKASVTFAAKNKIMEAVATVLPDSLVAAAHRKTSEPKAG